MKDYIGEQGDLMSKTMKRTVVFLTVRQVERLKSIQRETDAPVAATIRRAIDAHFDALYTAGSRARKRKFVLDSGGRDQAQF